LLIRPGAIGDFIVSLPAMEALRGDYTEVWCAEQNVALARFADRARSIGSAGLDRLGLMAAEDVVARLGEFDSIVSWYGTGRAEFRELVGGLGLPFEFLAALPGGRGHAVEFYRAQALGLGAVRVGRFPRLLVPEAGRTFAAVHPFASGVRKQVSMGRFEALAGRLGAVMPVRWVCGPEDELAGAVRIADLWELGCWLRGARVFVGNDSGIAHLAAAVGTPVLSLFRGGDPKVWIPRGIVYFGCENT
jgi:hypothetical protein